MSTHSGRNELAVLAASVSLTLAAVLVSNIVEAAPPDVNEIQAPRTTAPDTADVGRART